MLHKDAPGSLLLQSQRVKFSRGWATDLEADSSVKMHQRNQEVTFRVQNPFYLKATSFSKQPGHQAWLALAQRLTDSAAGTSALLTFTSSREAACEGPGDTSLG